MLIIRRANNYDQHCTLYIYKVSSSFYLSSSSGAVELNGVARRCQSLRLVPRDCMNNNMTSGYYNKNNNINQDTETADTHTKLLMDNQVNIKENVVPNSLLQIRNCCCKYYLSSEYFMFKINVMSFCCADLCSE